MAAVILATATAATWMTATAVVVVASAVPWGVLARWYRRHCTADGRLLARRLRACKVRG